MRRAGAPEQEIAKLRADGLERLIESRLVEKVVEESKAKATDEEITRTIEGIAKENGLTVEQLYASVVFHGLTVEEYRAQIKRDFERRNLVQGMLGSRVKVEDKEIEALYAERYGKRQESGESVHVRQILRAYGGASQRTQETACAEVQLARDRVAGGEPFEKVAAQVSEAAPRDGGDIGWLPLKSVAPWMSQALDGSAGRRDQRGARAAVRLRGAPARRAARARAGELRAGEGSALARALGAQARARVPDLDRGAARAQLHRAPRLFRRRRAARAGGVNGGSAKRSRSSSRPHLVERVHRVAEVERLEAREARLGDHLARRSSCSPSVPRPSPPGSESADDMQVSTEMPYISAAIGFFATFAS